MSSENVVNLVEIIQKKKIPKGFTFSFQKIFHKRVSAFLFDLMMISIVNAIIFSGYKFFVESHLYFLSFASKSNLTNGTEMIEAPIILITLLSYFTLSLYLYEGRTLGKKLMGIRTVDDKFINTYEQVSSELSLMQCYRRALTYALGYVTFGITLALSYFVKNHRGISEIYSQSTTISDHDYKKILEIKAHHQPQYEVDVFELIKAA
jgi:hypothetical protein